MSHCRYQFTLVLADLPQRQATEGPRAFKSPQMYPLTFPIMHDTDTHACESPLLNKRLVVGKEVTLAPLKGPGAKSSRDALVRLLYGKLFKWRSHGPSASACVRERRWVKQLAPLVGFGAKIETLLTRRKDTNCCYIVLCVCFITCSVNDALFRLHLTSKSV